MQTRTLQPWLPLLALLVAGGCSGLEVLGIKQKGGLEQVDRLLSHVERLRVEAAVAKERAQAAVERLRALLAPEFKGDPAAGHAQLVAAVEQSEEQADAFRDSLQPLKRTGEAVFARWAEDLGSFGNLAMRQRSQERLEETRKRFDAVLAAAGSAQLAQDAFNGDLADHALFLEHDFNATSVALMAQELDGLKSRGRELARRLDACAAACQAYVDFSAPRAQIEPPAPDPAPAAPAAPQPAGKPAPKTKPAPGAQGG